MAHLTKLEQKQRKERKQSEKEYKGNRSPQPYHRPTKAELEWRIANGKAD